MLLKTKANDQHLFRQNWKQISLGPIFGFLIRGNITKFDEKSSKTKVVRFLCQSKGNFSTNITRYGIPYFDIFLLFFRPKYRFLMENSDKGFMAKREHLNITSSCSLICVQYKQNGRSEIVTLPNTRALIFLSVHWLCLGLSFSYPACICIFCCCFCSSTDTKVQMRMWVWARKVSISVAFARWSQTESV